MKAGQSEKVMWFLRAVIVGTLWLFYDLPSVSSPHSLISILSFDCTKVLGSYRPSSFIGAPTTSFHCFGVHLFDWRQAH